MQPPPAFVGPDCADPAAAPLPEGKDESAARAQAASLGDLALDTSEYVRAWSALLASETRLAGASMLRMIGGLLVVPALALVICTAVDAFLITLLQRWLHDWSVCIGIVLCLDLACLYGLLLAIRAWWRDMSLPRSRAALMQLFGKAT